LFFLNNTQKSFSNFGDVYILLINYLGEKKEKKKKSDSATRYAIQEMGGAFSREEEGEKGGRGGEGGEKREKSPLLLWTLPTKLRKLHKKGRGKKGGGKKKKRGEKGKEKCPRSRSASFAVRRITQLLTNCRFITKKRKKGGGGGRKKRLEFSNFLKRDKKT